MKKFVSLFLVLALMATIVAVTFAADRSLGDANGDGNITAMDARLALRIATKLEKVDEDVAKAADLNDDGKVTPVDARIILRIATKLDSIENYTKADTEIPSETEENPSVMPVETTTAKPAETTTVKPAETTTVKPVEPTTVKPEEPTTVKPEEPTTVKPEEPTTLVMPDEANAFCNGNYYVEGKLLVDGKSQDLKMAAKGDAIEVVFTLDGIELGFYADEDKMILLNYSGENKTFCELSEIQDLMKQFNEEFDLEDELATAKPKFGKIDTTNATVKKTTVDKKDAYIWTVALDDLELSFTVIDGKVTKIESSDGEFIMDVTNLSAEIPADFYMSDSDQFKASKPLPFVVALVGAPKS